MYLSELSWLYASQVLRFFAVGLCLGTSTIVMVMYYRLVSIGKTDPIERNIMHLLYKILRVGMVLAVITEGTCFLYAFHVDNFIYWTNNPELLMRWTIFTVIVLNAFAMQYHKITMWLGPVFAGGSWYAYFFLSVWIETESTYGQILSGYLIWLGVVFCLLFVLRKHLTRQQKSGSDAGSIVNTVTQ